MLLIVFLYINTVSGSNSNQYDSFTGNLLTAEEMKQHDLKNTSLWCTKTVEPCDPNEFRRIDGTCNNLKYPSAGGIHTPPYRFLPSAFNDDNEPRRAKGGTELPLVRPVRTGLLLEGRLPDQRFTMLTLYYMMFISADFLSFHDTVNYLLWKPNCCDENRKSDYECIPMGIPDDDPVHRFSKHRCLNLTRPWSFNLKGCVSRNTPPERLVSSTPLYDFSQIYGSRLHMTNTRGRAFTGGLLKSDIWNGQEWPPTSKTPFKICVANVQPHETRCHNMPDDSINGVFGTNFCAVLFWRFHNLVARKLAATNPCWDDDWLFYTTRDIVIAVAMQIFYYELNPALMGMQNLLRDGVISLDDGFRDLYNEDVLPQVSIEHMFVLRWAHTMQEGTLKLYDSDGNIKGDIKVTDLTLRTGFMGDGNNMDYLTQGAFRQPSAKIDYAVDPDIAENGLGPLQEVADITASDLTKNRYFGLQPYIKYREACLGDVIKDFEDLKHTIDPERIQKLKELYEDVEDIDLMAGLWVEKLVPGGYVPATFYCLVVDQLLRSMVSDRHWYERMDRPYAFTNGQLKEIRKASAARLMCDVGSSVTHIQRSAFLLAGPGNEMVSCDEIDGINFDAWKDSTCDTG